LGGGLTGQEARELRLRGKFLEECAHTFQDARIGYPDCQPAHIGTILKAYRRHRGIAIAVTSQVLPHNRKYLGSKQRLLGFLEQTILSRVERVGVFADLFAGTGAVASHFRRLSLQVVANDLLYSNYVILRAFLCSSAANVRPSRLAELVEELDGLAGAPGYVSESYGGTYFTLENAARIDAVREAIELFHREGRCSDQERFVLLASLLLAADKAANTVGQYDAYLKHLDLEPAARAGSRHLVDSSVRKPLRLRLPALDLNGGEVNQAYNEDANVLIRRIQADVLYLDPPYNNRQYVDCYHVLENIMHWDKPRLYGKTRKFRREHLKSRYSRKRQAAAALAELLEVARAKHLFLSYNDEGILEDGQLRVILGRKGSVECFESEYAVFGNGAGSSRKRTLRERLYYCRPGSPRQLTLGWEPAGGPAPGAVGGCASGKVELFDPSGESRGYYSPRNRLNELTGKEWVYWTRSVITRQYPPDCQHALRSRHGGQKPPALCGDLIEVFTKRGQRVLDPFAGVGGTLLGASLRGRQAVGIEINPEWVEIYREVCRREGLAEQRLICGDSRHELPRLAAEGAPGGFDLLLTDVPYWQMDRVARSPGRFKRVGEQSRERRVSKLGRFSDGTPRSKAAWLEELGEVFGLALPLLRERAYVAVFIGDMYNGGRFHYLSADLARLLETLGLTPKANLIWYDVGKSLHVYGYQYEFIPSMIHQCILVFRKDTG
jgi:adenine-specific DNA methylase/DNA modification methylase